jgi:hypothetical protein
MRSYTNNIQNSKRKPSPIWMRWRAHRNGSGLFFLLSSPEEKINKNTHPLPTSVDVDRTWNFNDGGFGY